MAGRNNQFSFGDFVWFIGVVEEVLDPLQAGRVQVRIHGYHSQDKNELPTESLPWAMVALPTTGSSTQGIGFSPHGLIKGASVFGYFTDGENAQLPMIMFSFHGMNNGTPDVDKLSRGEVVQKQMDNAGTWSEKPSGAAPEYPHNKVYRTTSGHIIEMDDTPGKERLHVYHKSGTYHEFHPDGTLVTKVVGEHNHIVQKDMKVHVHGNVQLNVDGNVTEIIKGNKTSNITGNYKITCNAYSIETKASWTNKVGSSGYIKCGGTLTEKASTIFLN